MSTVWQRSPILGERVSKITALIGEDRELCSMVYTSVDEAVRVILELGPQAEIAKFDIERAYKLISVHLEDRPA